MTSAFDGLVLNKVALAVGQVTHIDPANIMAGLEEAFDLELPNEVVARFVTIGDAVRYLKPPLLPGLPGSPEGGRGIDPTRRLKASRRCPFQTGRPPTTLQL
jgi:hypothetical protein